MQHEPSSYRASAEAWWFAPIIAISPALLIALLAGYVPGWTDEIRALALVWGASAWAAVASLNGWHMVTARFSALSISTLVTIAAIVGGFAGLVAAMTGSPAADSSVRFLSAMLGSFQGAIVAWFLIGPTVSQPIAEEKRTPEPDEDANPPTSTP